METKKGYPKRRDEIEQIKEGRGKKEGKKGEKEGKKKRQTKK